MDRGFEIHVLDYVVAAVVLVVPLVIGVLFAYKDATKMTRLDYLLAGQQMTVIPVTMSTFVTFQSAISLIGMPNEVYTYGTGIVHFYLGLMSSYVVCAFTFVPLMYPLEVTSIYQYLHMRFQSQAVRMLSALIGSLQTVFYLSIALLSPALALQQAGNIPLWMSILVVGGVGTIYTVIGGIKSVIWTDVFQTLIVFVGQAVIVIKASIAVGGFGNAWSLAGDGERLKFSEVSPDPRVRMTVWSAFLSGLVMWLSIAYNQSTLQRIRSLRTLKDAKTSYLLNIPFMAFYAMFVILVGIVVYAYFKHMQCDPHQAGVISNRNQIVPYFVLHALNDMPGMAGLYVATLFCGSLSTLSSGINALAANTVEDLLERPLKNKSEWMATLVTKITAATFGVLICCIAYSAQYLDGPVTQMANTIIGAFGTPILGMFLISCAIPWSTKYGALAGGASSLVFNLWANLGSQFSGRTPPILPTIGTARCGNANASTFFVDSYLNGALSATNVSVDHTLVGEAGSSSRKDFSFYDVTYEWYPVYGTVVCLLVGVLVSLCTRQKNWRESQHRSRLVFSISRRIWGLGEDNKCQIEERTSLQEFAHKEV